MTNSKAGVCASGSGNALNGGRALRVRRVYAPVQADDGYRVLVDRLWPRGLKKEAAALDGWAKTVAPSAQLRQSFAHRPERFDDFCAAYTAELGANPDARAFVRLCAQTLAARSVTLLYAARDEACNNAVVLREWLCRQLMAQAPQSETPPAGGKNGG